MRTCLGKPIHQNLDLWLRSLENMRFEKVHSSVNGRNNVLPQLQSFKLYRHNYQCSGGHKWGKSTAAAVPQTSQVMQWRRLCNTDGQELQLSDPATTDIVIHILLAVSPQSAGSRLWVIMAYLTTKITALLSLLLNNMKFSPRAI